MNRLAEETPASLFVFDLLCGEDRRSLLDRPLRNRRNRLEAFARRFFILEGAFRLSPATADLREAARWLKRTGPALDGIVAKRLDMPYRSGERTAMQKIKNHRSVDCVVGGYRFAEGRRVVGSLLLGLYNEVGLLDHVGFSSGIREVDAPR